MPTQSWGNLFRYMAGISAIAAVYHSSNPLLAGLATGITVWSALMAIDHSLISAAQIKGK